MDDDAGNTEIFAAVVSDSIFESDRSGDGSLAEKRTDGADGGSFFQMAAVFSPRLIDPPVAIEVAKVVVPPGQTVVHIHADPGEAIELPFVSDAQFLARLGDGNLAIKVGGVTIVLEGYAALADDPGWPVTIVTSDGKPLDIAAILASTEPSLEIQTAAGPGGGSADGRGADNTGGIFQQFGAGEGGLGGFHGVGGQADSSGPNGGAGESEGVSEINITPAAIGPVNTAPVAADLVTTADEDHSFAGKLPATDADGNVLTYAAVGNLPTTVTIDKSGAWSFDPIGRFDQLKLGDHALVTFQYKVSDGTADSNTATVTIDVAGINDSPVAVDDSFAIDEDATLTIAAPGLLGNDQDVDGDALDVFALKDGPAHGKLAIGADGGLIYTPDANYHGTDSFFYRSEDAHGAPSDWAKVTITVNSVNDAPMASGDLFVTSEDTKLVIPVPVLLGDDEDPDGDALAIKEIVSPPLHGKLEVTDGEIVYTADADFHGTDSFGYVASDGKLASNFALVIIVVTPVADAPVANDDFYSIDEDQPLNAVIAGLGVLSNDTDGDRDLLRANLTSQPSHGTLNLLTDGTFVYVPDHEYSGTDSFTYKANDGSLESKLATVHITINPVDDTPVVADDTIITNQNTIPAPFYALLDNDKDVDSAHLSLALASQVGFQAIVIAPSGDEMTIQDDQTPGGSFGYKADDGSGLSTMAATVTVTHQTGLSLTGTAAHEVLVGGADAEKIDGGGGNDLIFAGAGDDTIFYHEGDRVQGGDNSAPTPPESLPALIGDVLAVDHNVDFTKVDLSRFDGIEVISLMEAGYGAGSAQSIALNASDVLSLSNAKVSLSYNALWVHLEATDQLYLSVTGNGDGWAGGVVGHDLVTNEIVTAYTHSPAGLSQDATVYVRTAETGAMPANVHLNEPMP